MARIHYISIPTIDNCNLPNDTIDKCFKAYERYGKYKIYDILNEELNSVRYPKAERVRLSNIDLIKRYLYLYRIAMTQTMSYVYNTEEYELNDMDIYGKDDDKVCPKCGEDLTVLPQRGTATYYPLSHYDDIIEKFSKIVTFTKFPVKSTLSISFKEYMSSRKYSEITDYKFMRWTVNKDGSPCDENAPVTSYLTDGKLVVYAAYASSATASSNSDILLSTDIRKTVKHAYSIYVSDLIKKLEKPTKNGYVFYYYTLPGEEDVPDELTEEQLNIDVSTILNDDYSIDIVNVFTGNKETSDYVIDYDAKVSDLQKLVGSEEKENYTFKGFTYEKYDEEMREVVIKPYTITTGNTARLSYIISTLAEDDIPWDYMDKETYEFDYWTINPDGSELTDVQNNTAISASSLLKLYAVFHNVYDETCEVHKMQDVYKDEWGENTIVLYSHYKYNIEEGTYCYDDRAYSCSTSDYLWYPETTITVDSLKTLKEIIEEYATNTYGDVDGHPEIKYEDFYGWAIANNANPVTEEDLEKKYREDSIIELYAVHKHEHKLYGIHNLTRYNTTGAICPICNKKVSYVGNYSEGTHSYVKDGYLDILRYTNMDGTLKWNKRYKNGANETTYGTILDISNISTLENMNKSTVIADGTVCVDTSQYADSSNSSYKIYIYNSKRDQNYDPSNVYVDPDLPENCESKWIYLPEDVTFTFLDTTGANKTKYLINGFWKCYLLGNGDMKVVKTDKQLNRLSATLISLANTFGLDSTIDVEINHDKKNYKAYYYINFSGYSIDDYTKYDSSEKKYIEMTREVDITFARTQSSFNGQYPNNVTVWSDKYIDDEGYINDGGYPTAKSIKTIKEIKPSEGLYTNGANDKIQSPYKLLPIKVFGLEPLTRKRQLMMALGGIITSGGISATEGSGGVSSMLDNGIIVQDNLGNIITSEDDYNGLNYSGWHWVAEDTTMHYDIDDGAENYVVNESNYPVLLSSLLTYKENNINVNSVQYAFKNYSIDGYTPITENQLQTTFVPASGGKFRIYKIYSIVNNVYGIGIVESDIFKDDKEFIESGYKRVLFISAYNSTGKLVRYCSNPSCYRLKKPLYQRKWSFKNQNATVKNTATGINYSNFSLDDYSFSQGTFKTNSDIWRYPQESTVKSVILHRGGSADIDEFRFDFEYKYATDEFESRKNSLPATVPVGTSKYKSYVLQNILKRVKGTRIVPMRDRPFEIYQNAYKEKLYKRFKEIYGKMIEFSPYSILNPDEINVMSSILQGFSYDLRLEIIAFMNTWNDYTNFTLNEWKDENYSNYIDIIKTNFQLMFDTNKISVGDEDLYLKDTILEYMILPVFNTLYSIVLNPDTGYKTESIKVNVSKEMFGSDASISKGTILEHVQNYYDPYRDVTINKNDYTFIRWTLSEDGSESKYDDINEFVPIGENSFITIYAYYESNKHIEIVDKGITVDWFNTYEDFVDKCYEEEEFIAETQIVLSQAASLIIPGRFVDGVTKSWFCKMYNGEDNPDEYSLEDYMNSFTYSEFNSKLREVINYTRNLVEYDTGVNENMTLNNVLIDLINNKNAEDDTETEKFLYWSLDGITPLSPNTMQDPTRVFKSYSKVKIYRVYELKNKIDSSSFNRNWYNGEAKTYETIKDSLSSFHERMALPISFMSYMIGLMIWPKRFVTMTSSNGEVGSYFLSANYGLPSNSTSEVLMHRLPTSGNTVFNIENIALSKRFPAALNTSTGDSIYEQYFVTAEANGKNFRIYSFMKNAWIDEVFTGSTAYDYCFMLNNTENPVTRYNPNKLIKIIPFSTKTDYSDLMLIYDNCITFFNCYKNVWMDERIKYVEDIFGDNTITIKGCSLNKEKGTVYILSSDNRIITYDIETDSYEGSDPKFVSYKYGEVNIPSTLSFVSSEVNKVSKSGKVSAKTTVDETAILAMNIANISNYILGEDEKPWIMLDKYPITPILPREISDTYYNELSDDDKAKYKLNEKLTLRYAYDNAEISEYPKTIESGGSSYTFVRLSFHTNGVNIADYELNSRLKGSIGLYAIYHKDGVIVHEKEGLTIATNEYTSRKDIFMNDLEKNQNNQGSFDSSIFGSVNDFSLPEKIDAIYALEGFEYESYAPVIALVSGTRVKICRWTDGIPTVLSTIDYNDSQKIMAVIPADSGRRTYIFYENQRITKLSTYRYIPSIFKNPSTTGEKITVMGENCDIRNLFVNYYTDKKEIHSVELSKDEYKDSQYYGRLLDVSRYINGQLTTYTDISISQTDFEFYAPIYPKWKIYSGEKTDLYKIN